MGWWYWLQIKLESEMITVQGFQGLLNLHKTKPDDSAMGFFVDVDFENTRKKILSATYYLSETREEDDKMDEQEDKYKSWLEYSTFLAIIDNKLEHHPNATNTELLDAIVYYLEEDDFLD